MKRTIIITGTSSGLGKALFDELSTQEVSLICISRSFLPPQRALEGAKIKLISCDLGVMKDVQVLTESLATLIASSEEVFFIDNAATVKPIGPIGDLSESEVSSAVQTNLISPMLITNALCRASKGKLTLIYVTTGAARSPIVGWPIYCATKAGQKMFYTVLDQQDATHTKSIVHEFNPGVMDTSMQEHIRQAPAEKFPRVQEFSMLKQTQKLTDPSVVAKRLIEECIPL